MHTSQQIEKPLEMLHMTMILECGTFWITYESLIHVLPDIRDDVSVVTLGQHGVQRVFLDGLQQPGGVAQPEDLHLTAGQPLHQVINRHVGGGAAQDLGNQDVQQRPSSNEA